MQVGLRSSGFYREILTYNELIINPADIETHLLTFTELITTYTQHFIPRKPMNNLSQNIIPAYIIGIIKFENRIKRLYTKNRFLNSSQTTTGRILTFLNNLVRCLLHENKSDKFNFLL